ncbi:hypothetical protein [Bradyrhizobium sp. 186]|uniref:hypothetical protein n=1 Tax=Bradyrhizobium sp. 186 TaxID=2782654 RepID=UPI002000F9C0|nr:hypothetical protein [Bradyrhizobium sp. 186]
MAVGSMVNSQSGDHAILRLFCPTCQTSSLAGLEPCRTKFFNDFYFAWGCFRVFWWSVPKERGARASAAGIRIDAGTPKCDVRALPIAPKAALGRQITSYALLAALYAASMGLYALLLAWHWGR